VFATPASLNAFESVLDDSSLDAIQHHLNLEDNLTDILELAKSQYAKPHFALFCF
jgi:hypothetical protein